MKFQHVCVCLQKCILLIFIHVIGLKIHKAVVLLWQTDIDLIFCITNIPNCCGKKKKALAVLLEERIDPISGMEDPTNTEQLSVKSSDTTTDFISRMRLGYIKCSRMNHLIWDQIHHRQG